MRVMTMGSSMMFAGRYRSELNERLEENKKANAAAKNTERKQAAENLRQRYLANRETLQKALATQYPLGIKTRFSLLDVLHIIAAKARSKTDLDVIGKKFGIEHQGNDERKVELFSALKHLWRLGLVEMDLWDAIRPDQVQITKFGQYVISTFDNA